MTQEKTQDFRIIIDTREQRPLLKNYKNIIYKKLEVGDYSIENYEDKIAIERKSPTDLFGSMFSGHKRFKKELEKSIGYEFFMILIEFPYTGVKNKTFDGSYYCKQQGHSLMSMLWTLKHKYHIDFMFSNSRIESSTILKDCFNSYIILKRKKIL